MRRIHAVMLALILFPAVPAPAAETIKPAAPAPANVSPAPAAVAPAPAAPAAAVPAPAATTPTTAASPASISAPAAAPAPTIAPPSADNTEAAPATPAVVAKSAVKKNPGIDASNFDSPFQSPAIRANLKAIAKSYGRYALKFGCSKFVWGTMTPDMSQFTLKYLPPDATMADWKKMTIVTVDALMGKPSKDQQMITNTIGKFEGQFKRADIITDKNYLDPQQEPMMFIQYNMSASFHVAAAYLRTGTTSASLIQLEERVDAMPDEDALEVHRLVFPQAGQPEPAKKK